MSLPIRCALCGSHSAESDLCPSPVFEYVCADAVACARRQLARHVMPDAALMGAARGVAQVDRAVRSYKAARRVYGPSAAFLPPASVRRAS